MRFLTRFLPLEWLVPSGLRSLDCQTVGSGLYVRGRPGEEPLRLEATAKAIFLAFDGSRSVARIAADLADDTARSVIALQREALHLMAELTARGWASWRVIRQTTRG